MAFVAHIDRRRTGAKLAAAMILTPGVSEAELSENPQHVHLAVGWAKLTRDQRTDPDERPRVAFEAARKATAFEHCRQQILVIGGKRRRTPKRSPAPGLRIARQCPVPDGYCLTTDGEFARYFRLADAAFQHRHGMSASGFAGIAYARLPDGSGAGKRRRNRSLLPRLLCRKIRSRVHFAEASVAATQRSSRSLMRINECCGTPNARAAVARLP